MYKSWIKKSRKKHEKVVSLAKSILNTLEVLIFKDWIDSYVRHDGFVSEINV